MQIQLTDELAADLEVDLLALGVRPEQAYDAPLQRLDALMNGAVKRELELRGFEGRASAQVSLPTYGAIGPRNLLLYGMGASPRARASGCWQRRRSPVPARFAGARRQSRLKAAPMPI